MAGINLWDVFRICGLKNTDSRKRLVKIDAVKLDFTVKRFKKVFGFTYNRYEARYGIVEIYVVTPFINSENSLNSLRMNIQHSAQYMNSVPSSGKSFGLLKQNALSTTDDG